MAILFCTEVIRARWYGEGIHNICAPLGKAVIPLQVTGRTWNQGKCLRRVYLDTSLSHFGPST